MKKLNLSTKIFIGLALGVILGLAINAFHLDFLLVNIIEPVGTIFLNLMKMVIVPLIFCTLIMSITNVGDMNKLGFLGKRTIIYYLCTTVIAAVIGLSVALIVQPGAGVPMNTEGFVMNETASLSKMIVDIVPSNPFKAFAEGNTLQVVVLAFFVGIAMTILGKKVENVKNFNNSCVDIIYKIVEMIMKVAPIAVVALIADVVATNGLSIFKSLFKLLIVIIIASMLQLVVYGVSVKGFGKMNPFKFFKAIMPAQMLSFTTASSAATLPLSMKTAKESLGVSETVANFVLNLGSTINMDGGAIYQASCAIFIAQIYGINLSISQMFIIVITASLASIGAAAIPGTVIVMMTMVLSSVGLPIEAIALIAGIDRILDMITTSVNVSGDIAACVFVASVEEKAGK
nr:dicarboxylate/amino acid:cation symporter [uncultured Cellulosilyticum sp.]